MKLPVLRTALFSILFLSACASLQGGMASLNTALSSVASLSSSIGQFTSSLQGVPGEAQLKQIAGYSDQAAKLATTLKDAAGNVPTSTQDGIDKIQGMLGRLGSESFGLDSLKALAPDGLNSRITELSQIGQQLGVTTDSVLGMLPK